MFALFYTFIYINDVKKRILAKSQRSSLRIHLWASERSGVFNSYTVKKVNFFTINVKFKVILSSKSGGDICTGPPLPTQKVVGGGVDTSPIPPGIYASACWPLRFLRCYDLYAHPTLVLSFQNLQKLGVNEPLLMPVLLYGINLL